MNGRAKDRPDDAPIRPVSSLLSHFENLSHPRLDETSRFLNSTDPTKGDAPRTLARASCDLERPHSPWGLNPDSRPPQRYGHANGDGLRRRGSSAARRERPISAVFPPPSPQPAPTLTINSPRSPPRSNGDRKYEETLNNVTRTRLSQSPPDLARECVPPIPPRLSPRPTTPISGSLIPREQHLSRPSPSTPPLPASDGRLSPSPMSGKAKSSSVPPPVNRAEKPKIPIKPPNLVQNADTVSLTPHPVRSSSLARPVSPFATPPESPEMKPERQASPENINKLTPTSRSSTEPTRARSSEGRVPRLPARDARELGFTRRRPIPEPSRDTKPSMMQHVPPPPRMPARPGTHAAPFPASRGSISDAQHDRPSLPPRQPNLPSRPGHVSPSRQQQTHNAPDSSVRPTSVAKVEGTSLHPNGTRALIYVQPLPPPPPVLHPTPVSRSTKPGMQPDRQSPTRAEPEGEDLPLEEPKFRSDFPDSTQVNRRPPYLKSGPREIPTRYDTRLFDVCGKYVCTTGYLTRVWDLATGEQIMSLSHGETVKCLSVAFKPGQGLQDEGQRLWLGTSVGELHEVDIATQSIVASRAYPSRREVIKILRHKKELWTIDDEGKLLVWYPDETGTPNLQYSYHTPVDRVAKGHTFSMVIGDRLWLATGREVHVYEPSAQDAASFKVLKRPLSRLHTGDVTSGAYTSKNGGLVYLGHADGKITVYSPTDFSCITCVSVSTYKINCLSMVGDYLWAAYNTGMMYVYDTSANPWVVKKDWRAHDKPVCGFLLDASSLWTLNRMQVTSLGDNCIRLWDGSLEDDWLDARMQARDVEYCTFREIQASILTWNAGASSPGSVRDNDFIEDAIHPNNPPEILIFGFQELVDLENKTITAKSLLLGSKKKDSGEKEHMSRQYRVWIEHLTRRINDCMPLDESYVLLHTANLVGLFTCIFIKHSERQRIKNISAAEVKRGMGGLHGNKGALILRFILDDTSLCFVNCHLAAGQSQTAHRNNDIAAILESDSLAPENSPTTRADRFVGGGDGSMIPDHEICILNGDLNYRIDSIPRNVVIDDIRNNNLTKLLDRDQLLASRRKNPGFRLRSFNEGAITFAPTYKYDVGTDNYDSSEKKRAPAWCDRVLYRGLGKIKQIEYRRHEVRASDHRPVSALFKLRIKTVMPNERATTWEVCQEEFQLERRRLASEASIEYLINILGTKPDEARKLILEHDAKK